MWAGIKHALNSTLGTSAFKPLNVQIDEQTDLIESFILRNKRYIASENTLVSWNNAFELQSLPTGATRTIGTFKPYISGFANIKIWAYTLNGDYSRVNIKVYEDNTLKYETGGFSNENNFDDAYTVEIENCYFVANKEYRFEFVSTTRPQQPNIGTGFKYLKLNADIIDGFAYDYTIGE